MGPIAREPSTEFPESNFPLVNKDHIKPGYHYLSVDFSHINDYEVLFKNLKEYVEYLLQEIDKILAEKEKRIENFTIGKTFANLRKTSPNTTSDANSKTGICKRYHNFYKKNEYDCLIGFSIIRRTNVPSEVPNAFKTKKMLTLGLEHRLIEHFAYIKPDHRLGNRSFHPGRSGRKAHAVGVIYIAIKLCRNSSDTNRDTNPDTENSSDSNIDTNPDTDSNSDSNSDTNTDIECNRDGNNDTNLDTESSSDSNIDTNPDTDSNSDSNSATNTDIERNRDDNNNTNLDTESSSDSNIDTNLDTDSNRYSNSDTNTDTERNRDGNNNTNRHREQQR